VTAVDPPSGATVPHILVVEDDFAVQRSFTRMLSTAGFDVVTAADGRAALALLASRHFDAIVCDILMPHMDGMELYERLRAEHPDEAEHVVFVTGWSQEAPVATFLDRSGCPHLNKPVDSEDLLGVVRRLTGGERPAPPPAQRETLAPFAPEETATIRRAIVTAGARLACPRCGGDLESGAPIGGGGSIALVWLLRCEPCQRSVIVRDLPDSPSADHN
jgi:DNA-binding response OmpR family regulator